MITEISVPAEMADDLGRFLAAESIDLSAVTDKSASVKVVPTGPQRQGGDLETLYAGGWISCQNGRDLAEKLGIDAGDVGKLLDHLKIKVRACVLGCF